MRRPARCSATPDALPRQPPWCSYNRAVQFPPAGGQGEGPVLQYDVIGHPQADFHFAVVFPYHSSDGTVTLIREYAQVAGWLGGGRMLMHQQLAMA